MVGSMISGLSRFNIAPAAARRVGGHAPLPRERTFGTEQLLVSKTDLKGVITYANDTFAKIAGYPREELEGQPHSIIRHPHFPGGVFELMWQTIEAGRECFAYVKNLAKDGSFYWVLAHVTPTFDHDGRINGYHSLRRAPERQALEELEPLYAKLLEIETQIPNRAQAARTSFETLIGDLRAQGTDYDTFIWDVINRTGQEL